MKFHCEAFPDAEDDDGFSFGSVEIVVLGALCVVLFFGKWREGVWIEQFIVGLLP